MAYNILINSINRTADVLNGTVKIQSIINDQVDTCNFSLIDLSGNGLPSPDQEVIITLADGTILFGGYIISTNTKKRDTGSPQADINCVDYSRLLNHNLVHKSYQSMTDKAIIEDLVATYCAGLGITTTHVLSSATIDQISFNYVQVSQALRRLADLTAQNWYIDESKDIHYFPLTTNAAPFNITSTNNQYSNLNISKDASQLKNRVYVRGGTKLSDATTYQTKGDGIAKKFVLPDKPHNVSVAVNGTPKTLGIKNVDTSGFQFYLNFEEKYLEQDTTETVLATTDTLTVGYQYDIPILVAQEDTASILASGVHEFAIFDKSISTTDAARERAIAELTDYANNLIEGSFTTFTTGFRSGQYININLSEYGINTNYIIQKVSAVSFGAGNFEYTISIASAKTMGIIRFLIELLEANKNLIELSSDEVVDELFTVADSLNADSLLDSLVIDSAGPYRTWAVYGGPNATTALKWDLGQWK